MCRFGQVVGTILRNGDPHRVVTQQFADTGRLLEPGSSGFTEVPYDRIEAQLSALDVSVECAACGWVGLSDELTCYTGDGQDECGVCFEKAVGQRDV